jgi:hypothetical protein
MRLCDYLFLALVLGTIPLEAAHAADAQTARHERRHGAKGQLLANDTSPSGAGDLREIRQAMHADLHSPSANVQPQTLVGTDKGISSINGTGMVGRQNSGINGTKMGAQHNGIINGTGMRARR